MSLNFIVSWKNDKWYNKRVLIWRFTLVLIKINYGQIGDQKVSFIQQTQIIMGLLIFYPWYIKSSRRQSKVYTSNFGGNQLQMKALRVDMSLQWDTLSWFREVVNTHSIVFGLNRVFENWYLYPFRNISFWCNWKKLFYISNAVHIFVS